jgi:uncharacterized protein (TIGR02996 family)
MIDRDAFLAAITAAPWDDEAPRGAYADWLDERGEHEEADRQRRHVAAERWLRAFAEQHHLYAGYPEGIREVVEERYCHGSDGDSLCEDLADEPDLRADLYENWQVVTGKRLPLRAVVRTDFTCGC